MRRLSTPYFKVRDATKSQRASARSGSTTIL